MTTAQTLNPYAAFHLGEMMDEALIVFKVLVYSALGASALKCFGQFLPANVDYWNGSELALVIVLFPVIVLGLVLFVWQRGQAVSDERNLGS
ncbi:MAG: hypothetical protein AAF685_08825 [Cyanobacteria bacterium P01_C01_bin.89]